MSNDKQQDQVHSKNENRASTIADGDDRYRTLIENIPGAVYRCAVDKHWTMEFISAAIQTITGFKADDFVHNRVRSYASIIHPDDVDMVEKKVQAAIEAMVPFVLHYRIIDAQEEVKWVYEKGRAFYGRDNVPLWLDGVIFDYTEQYTARQILETEHAQLLSIFDSMDEVIYIADPKNFNLLYGNEVFRKNWGDPIGQKCYRALQGRDAPCPFCTNDMIFGENLGKTYIWEFRNEVNQRWYRCIDRAIKWTDGSMVRFEMAIDNHELKMAQIELEEHRKHLEKLVKKRTSQLGVAKKQAETANAAKSDFLARMSHEIRTPLNAVTGLTNIVLNSDLTTEQRDYLNKVKLAGSSLLKVINDILDFSKVEAGQLDLEQHPFQLDQIMEQLADLFGEQAAHKDVELVFAIDAHVPMHLIGDGPRLSQVLINLVANAVKFTESGEIEVAVTKSDQVAKQDHQTGQTVLNFSVRDTGIGIPADVLPSLFEPFTQDGNYLTRKHEGTGLGLAICRQLVGLMGGTIDVKSTPGKGSIFSFTAKLEIDKEQKPALALAAHLHGLKALVVDDNTSARNVLVDRLESFTFNVTVVDSGKKAIDQLRRAYQDEPYRLVLLEWKMPGMNGIEAARRIRALESEIQAEGNQQSKPLIIILITAHGRELLQEHIDTSPVDAMLLKPVKPSQLLNCIMELFGQTADPTMGRSCDLHVRSIKRLSDRRVLVVEDSELNRDVAVALLEESGLIVDVAENGKIAVDQVTKSPKGYYDVVLMDIQMPVMDGYEATRHIREWEFKVQSSKYKVDETTVQQPETINQKPQTRLPIIALTAHALKGEKEKCIAFDMDDYLAKPLDDEELQRVLVKWIAPQDE